MKWKSYLPPVALLLMLLALSLWNSGTMTAQTDQLREQLQEVDALARAACWPAAQGALSDSYQDWSAHQTYLHIVLPHDAVDEVETLYRRAASFAETAELPELRAELAELQAKLTLLSEMERFTLKNTL